MSVKVTVGEHLRPCQPDAAGKRISNSRGSLRRKLSCRKAALQRPESSCPSLPLG